MEKSKAFNAAFAKASRVLQTMYSALFSEEIRRSLNDSEQQEYQTIVFGSLINIIYGHIAVSADIEEWQLRDQQDELSEFISSLISKIQEHIIKTFNVEFPTEYDD